MTVDRQSKRRQGLIVLSAGLLAAGALVVTLASRHSTNDARPSPSATAQLRAAPLGGPSFASFGAHDRVYLASFRGKPLVVNYWASWCPFCAMEMPDFQKVYAETCDRVAFLGIDIKDDHGAAADLARQTGVRYPLAVDPDGSTFQKLGGFAMPTTFFIDEKGRVVQTFSGPLTADGLRSQIRHLFGV